MSRDSFLCPPDLPWEERTVSSAELYYRLEKLGQALVGRHPLTWTGWFLWLLIALGRYSLNPKEPQFYEDFLHDLHNIIDKRLEEGAW